jgi:DNA-binding response OmpR family regulator
MKILVVDDEKVMVKGLRFNLLQEGWQVVCAYTGEEALILAKNENPDIVILDLMLPSMSGLDVCTKLREFSDVPVIMLTARADDMDKLMGFDSGADDYVVKPFNVLELKARIRALYRRDTRIPRQKQEETAAEVLRNGPITLNPVQRSATLNGEPVELTVREFDLMELLMRNPGRVYSRTQLLNKVWSMEYQGDDRTVDVHIRRLREKLEPNPSHPKYIMTKWGVGYYMKE